jgi:hypothetical protein
VLSSYEPKFSVARQHSGNERFCGRCHLPALGHVIVGAPKEKNVRHNCSGLRGVWSDGDASSGHAGSGASLPRMCAKGEKRGQTSSSRKDVGREKSDPRTRVVGFVGQSVDCLTPFPRAFFQIKSPQRNRGIRTSRGVVLGLFWNEGLVLATSAGFLVSYAQARTTSRISSCYPASSCWVSPLKKVIKSASASS